MSESYDDPEFPQLSFHETILAASAARGVGHAALARYLVDDQGNRYLNVVDMEPEEYQDLMMDFVDHEQAVLSSFRESLTGIRSDRRLDGRQKAERLERYFDAYTSLTLKLDHAAHPPTGHEVGEGIPAYVPDGFVDLGSQATVDSARRYREMIVVNKEAMYQRYRGVLTGILSTDYSNMTEREAVNHMYDTIGRAVHESLPYDMDMKSYRGERVDLATMPEGVCRHRALTFQVLAQAVGLKTRMVKGRVRSGGEMMRHAVVLTENNGVWELNDVTDPILEDEDGHTEWHPRVMRVDGPPAPGESKAYRGRTSYDDEPYEFVTDDNSYWIIRPEWDHASPES